MFDKFHEILEFVKESRGVDFNAYRPGTITRSLERRLQSTGMHDYASYYEYLKENPGEIDALIDAFTIKVSYFFRNPIIFEVLRNYVLPELIDSHRSDALRIWCGGCARGEEAYSLAILLREIMDKEAEFPHTLIIATDIDTRALENARKAQYEADVLTEVKKGFLDKYFIVNNSFYSLKYEIRSMVTFVYHDVTTCSSPKDGIFSDYHLILCRNVLIYFDIDLQKRVLEFLSDSLLNKGYLILGEAETIPPPLIGEFKEIIPRTKIFRKEKRLN